MEMLNNRVRSWCALALIAGVGLLAGCAGTVKQDTRVRGDVSRVEGVAQVVTQMTPEAVKLQADNPQFSRDELAAYLKRRLESKGLVAPAATHKVEVVVTDIRVRSAVAAIMLGFMAGEDRVVGNVRILDPNGKALRSFEVRATYAFGGWGGGQDGLRMNWMYDKFSELATLELEKVIGRPSAALAAMPAPAAVAVATAAAPAVAPAAAPAPLADTLASTGGNVQDVDAVPVHDGCKQGYREWLSFQPPRAFVVADAKRCNWARGTNPKEAHLPRDPAQRAMQLCREQGKTNCTVYAVDDRVVYVKPTAVSQR